VSLKVLKAVTRDLTVFWGVTTCILVFRYQHWNGTSCH